MKTLACALSALLLLGRLAAADVVTTRDGRKYDGKIVEETATTVTVETKGGKFKIERSKILSIEKIKSKAEEFDERAALLKDDDADGWFQLGQWAREVGHTEGFTRAMNAVLKASPDHPRAREALGYVLHEGRWVPKAERDAALKKKEEEEKKARGLVLYKGRWVPREEKESLEKGLVLHEGKWVTKEEKARLEKGLVLYEGRWVTPEEKENLEKGLFKVAGKWVTKEKANEYRSDWENAWEIKSDHYVVRSNCDYDRITLFIHEAELAWKGLAELLQAEPKTAGLNLYVFASGDEYNNYNKGLPDNYLSLHTSSWGGSYVFPKEEKAAVAYLHPGDPWWTKAYIVHSVSEQFLAEATKITAPWLVEGLAHYMVHFHHERVPAITFYRDKLLGAGGIEPLDALLAREELFSRGNAADDVANVRFFDQAGTLVYFLLRGPKYGEAFQKFLVEAAKNGKETASFKAQFKNLREVHEDFVNFLRAGNPFEPPKKEAPGGGPK